MVLSLILLQRFSCDLDIPQTIDVSRYETIKKQKKQKRKKKKKEKEKFCFF
jgi:hypothetical protein